MTQKIFIKLIAFSIVFSCILSSKLSAQFQWVQIGVDGLTCSQCTRSVEMNIRKLDFVDSVSMNLENTEGKILFKPGKKVSIEQIADAVMDAGFSVRYLQASFAFNNLEIFDGFIWENESEQYCFVKSGRKTLNGEAQLVFVGKKYMPLKEYKIWMKEIGICNGTNKKRLYCVNT